MKILGFNIDSFKTEKKTIQNKVDHVNNNSTKKNKDSVILKITENFKDTSRKDIQGWRTALMSASHIETPKFNLYFDLVDNLSIDGTFKTQILLRKSATLAMDFQVRNNKTGEINEQATTLLRQKWFYSFISSYLDSIIFGTKVIEFLEFNGHNIKFSIIPERHTVTPLKRIYPDLSNDSVYINYTDPTFKPWVIELNSDKAFGLINDIIPNLIWKRNVTQSWAEFCEKFGMPMVSATTNNNNPEHIDKVEKQLLSLAEASVGVFPEGTTIKFDEANRTDAYNVYSKFIEHNSNEISGVLVGSSTLSQEAANRSQTEVHERSLDYKICQADRRDIGFTINDELFPLLKIQGYNYISDDDVFEWIESKEEVDISEYWEIVSGMMTNGYEIKQDWLSETFNIPIVGKRETKYTQPTTTTNNNQNEGKPENFNQPSASFKRPEY